MGSICLCVLVSNSNTKRAPCNMQQLDLSEAQPENLVVQPDSKNIVRSIHRHKLFQTHLP
eukprot:264681-Amphidinium_carterae.1